MDSLPTPLSSLVGIAVPLLDITPYDFKGLPGFPLRHGFDNSQMTVSLESPPQTVAIIQSWLYFGVLSEIAQHPIHLEDFTCYVAHSTYPIQITAVGLKSLLEGIPSADRVDETELHRRGSIIKEAILLLRNIEEGALHQLHRSPLVEITLSIRMLFYALGPYAGWPFLELRPHPLISKRLAERGWCPSHIHRVEGQKNDITGYYLSCLHRPNPRGFDHSSCPKTNCEASSTTLSGDYIISHTHPGSSLCPLVRVDTDQVCEIIADGGIPLMSICILPDDTIKLRIRAAKPRDSYVAISHVWSDGLGNPQSNALPECQLRRLSTYLSRLPNPSFRDPDNEFRTLYSYGPISLNIAKFKLEYRPPNQSMPFWMDTLCIPVSSDPDDEWTKELKKRAINQMANIYGKATQVLIIDSALQEARIGAMQQSETLAHITFSNWMGRCWTLQEGALNPYVYFQFADGALNLFDMPRPRSRESLLPLHPAKFQRMGFEDNTTSMTWAWKHRKNPQYRISHSTPGHWFETLIYETLYKLCMNSLHNSGHGPAENYFLAPLDDISLPDAQWVQRLTLVWNALTVRTTTMAEDLPVIFANLLGVDAYAVLALPLEQRLASILGAGRMLPLSLLWNRGPRLKPGDNHRGRWIPMLLGRFILEQVPVMRFDPARHLVLSCSDTIEKRRPDFLLINTPIPIEQTKTILTTSSGVRWHITLHREDNDRLDIAPYSSTGFVIEKTLYDARPLPADGCCLRLSSQSAGVAYKGIYDCPCTAERIAGSEVDTGVVDEYAAEKVESWTITVLTEHMELVPALQKTPQRNTGRNLGLG